MFITIRSLFKVFLVAIFLTMSLFVGNGLSQESYPNRPITMVCWSGAGGQQDVLTRTLCKAAEKELGQPIVVENKTGASGIIGVNFVLKSKPDGYTLGVATTSAYINLPHIKKTPFNVLTDITDIMTFTKVAHNLSVRADSPWNTFEDVIKFSKENPGKFKYGHVGIGSTQQVYMEMIAMKEGVKWTGIPFKGNTESVVACLGGHIDAVAAGPLDVVSFVKAKKLKLLLLLTDSRWPDFPDVPTVLEKGYDFFISNRMGFFGPKGMTDPVRQKLEDAFKKAMKDPSFIEMMNKFQLEIAYMSGKDYTGYWRSRYETMGRAIKALGIEEQ